MIRAFNPLFSYDSISDFKDYINLYIYIYIYLFFLGGTLALNELYFDKGEQRQLNESPFSKVHLSHLFQKLWAWRNS